MAASQPIHPQRAPAAARWTKIYEDPREDFGFAFLSMSGRTWYAPGDAVIVVGQEDGADATVYPMKGQFLQRVGTLADGTVLAVGSPMTIAQFDNNRWTPHEVRATPTKNRFGDILAYLDEVEEPGRVRVLASGPVALVERTGPRSWQATARNSREKLRALTRTAPPGATCSSLLGRWSRGPTVFYVCDEGGAFLYGGGIHTPLPPMSEQCARSVGGANITDSGLAFVCEEGVMFAKHGASAWTQLETPDDLRSVALGSKCLLANSQNVVWRWCPTQ